MDSPSDNSKQEFAKEKILSKLFTAFQALTYSCCAEQMECIRQYNASSATSKKNLFSKFGFKRITCDGKLLILPEKKDFFTGRIGRLRYFAFCAMAAAVPLSLEVVQLSLDFPNRIAASTATNAQCRAPIVYPILCGHVLTHVVASLCASCGQDMAGSHSTDSLIGANAYQKDATTDSRFKQNNFNTCISFIQLGYLARVLQVLLGYIQEKFHRTELEWNQWEKAISQTITFMLDQRKDLKPWEVTCCNLLHSALSRESSKRNAFESSAKINPQILLEAFEIAKHEGSKLVFFCCTIFQVLFPQASAIFIHLDSNEESLFEVMNISLDSMMGSALVCEIIRHWYEEARPQLQMNELKKLLDCKHTFKAVDWPIEVNHLKSSELKRDLPLFQGTFLVSDGKPRVKSLPYSYTDLYTQLGAMKPNCESLAICLTCGEVRA